MNSKTDNIYSDSATVIIVEESNQLMLEYPSGNANYDLKTLGTVSVNTNLIYRPIQYLGSKHRPLPIILSKTLESVRPNTHVIDLFSGSTVVSQVFNLNGLNVIANDAMKFNSAFANTLLNIERDGSDIENISTALTELKSFRLKEEFTNPFQEEIRIEKELLMAKRTKELLDLYFGLPQVSKVLFLNGSNSHEQTKTILGNIGRSAVNNCPLIANYYAGSYFSIYQALELDRLRNGIENMLAAKRISKWQYHFLLTCLLNVCSKDRLEENGIATFF